MAAFYNNVTILQFATIILFVTNLICSTNLTSSLLPFMKFESREVFNSFMTEVLIINGLVSI